MTNKQHACLLYIHQFTLRNGYPPTRKEIAAGCGTGVSTVYKWFEIFEAMGYITTTRSWRGIEILRLPGQKVA